MIKIAFCKKSALLLALLFCASVFLSCGAEKKTAVKTDDELYDAAVRDAVFADEDEILPLVNITKEDENVLWDGDRVLVCFLHKYPESYPDGQDINLKWGNVWCVSALEFIKWIQSNSEGVTDWSLRLHQAMGMPAGKATSVTTMWVDADLLLRPAYVTGNTSEMKNTLQATGDEAFDRMYKEWFDGNIVWSYFDSAYPWTRLGYTYDWADNGKEYGVTEFLIFSGADAKVDRTLDAEAFADYALNFRH